MSGGEDEGGPVFRGNTAQQYGDSNTQNNYYQVGPGTPVAWRRVVPVVLAVGLLFLTAALLLALDLFGPGPQGRPVGASAVPSTAGPGAEASSPSVYYSGSLTFDGSGGGNAYDLDHSPPVPFGPGDNTLNLRTDEIDVVVPNGARAAPSSSAPALPGRQQCVEALARAPGDFEGIYQRPAVGTTFCFRTAGGRYGAVRVTDASAHYVIGVVVWP